MRIMIADALLAEVYAHARRAFPDECCGYLVGADGVDQVVTCHNTEAVPARGFAIDGAELFAFARSLDGPRPARIVYHSHPNGRAYFSETDRARALDARYPVQHLVVGVTPERVTECAQFVLRDHEIVELARWSP